MDTALRSAMQAVGNDIRVAMPGEITAFDPDAQTVTVQLTLTEGVTNGGSITETRIPLLVDVPVVMPRAGGYMLAFAPRAGDECLVIFGDCCIDAWWQSGGVQAQAERRRHDLSDGFAVLGCWSQPNRPQLPAKGVRLQNDAGSAGISIIDGTVNIFGKFTINGKSYSAHTHPTSVGDTGGVN